jgi:uncharacterized glyoxalase superfamily protein PhnB
MAIYYAKDCSSAVIPSMRYRDAHAAIDWLVRAIGFEKQVVYEGPHGTVTHAQLTFGNGMIMLGSVSNAGEWGRMIAQPDEIGGRETVTCTLLVDDATSVHALAQAAGAEMVQALERMPYGGRAFGCKDPEGHLWFIGEYNPWAPAPTSEQ